ncbi:MAG: hypothetical protein WKF35_03695 [Ferruginibacter sp.]
MKKILLATIVAMSFMVADAQTTKSKKSKKKYVSPEAKAKAKQKAEYARIQKETDLKIEEYKTASYQEDSLRMDSDRVAKEIFDLERKTYLENKTKEQDSTNKLTWKKLSDEKEQWTKTDQSYDAVHKAANLGTYESRQVKVINQTYYDKAMFVQNNVEITDDVKKQQLVALNTERRTKIKAVIGSSKDKKLEKERKEYIKNKGENIQYKWIDEATGYANNNKK